MYIVSTTAQNNNRRVYDFSLRLLLRLHSRSLCFHLDFNMLVVRSFARSIHFVRLRYDTFLTAGTGNALKVSLTVN